MTDLGSNSRSEKFSMESETSTDLTVLKIAWLRFSELDTTISARTKTSRQIRLWVAIAGVLGILVAVFSNFFSTNSGASGANAKVVPVLIPVIGAGLAAFSKLFFSSSDWQVMRAAAEEIKKNIYIYRTILKNIGSRREWLEKRLAAIMRQTYQGMGFQLTLTPYTGSLPSDYDPKNPDSDPGFNDLTGDEYFRYRLEKQLLWYRKEIKRQQDLRLRYQVLIIVACVVIAFLVVMGGVFSQGVELLASLTVALLGWQESQSIDPIIKNHSKIVIELTVIHHHWEFLKPEERTEREFFKMVHGCEDVLWAQNVEYIKAMQEPLRESSLEEEVSLISRVIKESVESERRIKENMMDSIVEFTQDSLQEDEEEKN